MCKKGKREVKMVVKQEKPLEKLQEKEQKIVLYGEGGPNSDFIDA